MSPERSKPIPIVEWEDRRARVDLKAVSTALDRVALASCRFAYEREEIAPHPDSHNQLDLVKLQFEEGRLKMTCANSWRLALAQVPTNYQGEPVVAYVPVKSLQGVVASLPANVSSVDLQVVGNQLLCQLPSGHSANLPTHVQEWPDVCTGLSLPPDAGIALSGQTLWQAVKGLSRDRHSLLVIQSQSVPGVGSAVSVQHHHYEKPPGPAGRPIRFLKVLPGLARSELSLAVMSRYLIEPARAMRDRQLLFHHHRPSAPLAISLQDEQDLPTEEKTLLYLMLPVWWKTRAAPRFQMD